MSKRNKIAGFSLLEILVTTGIILVLTSIGVASFASANKRSRDARRTSDIQQLRSALEMYRSDNGYYPPVNPAFGTIAALGAVLVPTYMSVLPNDPKAGQQYYYQATNASGAPARYYGYCVCGRYEAQSGGTCTTLAGNCTYGERNP